MLTKELISQKWLIPTCVISGNHSILTEWYDLDEQFFSEFLPPTKPTVTNTSKKPNFADTKVTQFSVHQQKKIKKKLSKHYIQECEVRMKNGKERLPNIFHQIVHIPVRSVDANVRYNGVHYRCQN